MTNNKSEKIEHCFTCRKFVHFDCMTRWKKNSNTSAVTCPLCRQPWSGKAKGNSNNSKQNVEEGYLNLRQLQGQSSQRDTSTYHQHWDDHDDY